MCYVTVSCNMCSITVSCNMCCVTPELSSKLSNLFGGGGEESGKTEGGKTEKVWMFLCLTGVLFKLLIIQINWLSFHFT